MLEDKKMDAKSICNLIDVRHDDLEERIRINLWGQTIDELLEVGFSHIGKTCDKYNLDNCSDDIKETGNILMYKGVIVAVTWEGIYVNSLILIEENMELDFANFINFGNKQYNDLYELIDKLFKEDGYIEKLANRYREERLCE